MGAYEQREQAFAHLAAISSEEFAKKCWMIVRSDAHVYGIECEVFRMSIATQLFLAGISEAEILETLESQTEQILMMFKGRGFLMFISIETVITIIVVCLLIGYVIGRCGR